MKAIGIIPARYASTRFPGKPLTPIGDKSMIQMVYEQSAKSGLDQVMVATDDKRIADHVRSFGGTAVMTSAFHTTGTERCAEALGYAEGHYDVVLNIQGDEPFIEPALLDQLVKSFIDDTVQIATAVRTIDNNDELFSPHTVKVVRSQDSFALYFSRSPIPHIRNIEPAHWLEHHQFLCHIGIYAFRAEILPKIIKLPITPTEQTESLEQLRWLSNGYKIKLLETEYRSISVDTPQDLKKANELYWEKFTSSTNP
jgi:3-deoxy-manno-octulosonate cytidylyltransferase (CMP-KDO synthetase)